MSMGFNAYYNLNPSPSRYQGPSPMQGPFESSGSPNNMPQYGSMSPPSRSNMSPQVAYQLFVNDEVDVYIQSRGWVLGVVIGVLNFFDKFAGMGYTIRYYPNGPQSAVKEGKFPPNNVRPHT